MPPRIESRHLKARLAAGIGGLVAVIGILLGYGIPVTVRMVTVHDSQVQAHHVARANDLWRMIAGTMPIEDSPLGHLAADTRRLLEQPNQVKALRAERVAAGEYPDVSDEIGYEFYQDVTNDREGTFSYRYMFDALQARPDTVGDLILPIPPVRDYGWLRWEWGVAAIVAVALLTWLVQTVIRFAQHRYRRRYVKQLGPQAEEVWFWIQQVESWPQSTERTDALAEANSLFEKLRLGLGQVAAKKEQARQAEELAHLRARLSEIAESHRFKLAIYEEELP